MASIDLWIDGSGLECHAGWRQPIAFNFDRFEEDKRFAEVISDHINRSLENLAREIEEIGTNL